jgi:glutamate--cysteine ligase
LNQTLSDRLKWLSQQSPDVLHYVRGIEKEGLRVTPNARLSQTNHPIGLGSALTHPSITTDYSEALLEFITPATSEPKKNLAFLADLHRFSYLHLADDELIWPGSMPATIENELDVRIAEYGTSNIGQLKHIYRHGLWHRYGRIMQTIAGLHFNFSIADSFWQSYQELLQNRQPLKDFKSQGYFSMIRNFRRYSWVLMYLYGASPAADSSFFQNSDKPVTHMSGHTELSPWATSLRMSDVGYTNQAQSDLNICFNSLRTYLTTLADAIHKPYPPYEAMGIKKDGQYLQINTNILQIENEYYSDIRPKRVTQSGEKPICALHKRGVEYIEVRCLDLNPYEPLGINQNQIAFMDLFLTWCLLNDSPIIPDDECDRLQENLQQVINEGRRPDLTLRSADKELQLSDWLEKILNDLNELADVMDGIQGQDQYRTAIRTAMASHQNPDQLPSARVHQAVTEGQEYTELMLHLAQQHRETLKPDSLDNEQNIRFEHMVKESLQEQQEIEREDDITLDQFIEQYQVQDTLLADLRDPW